MGQTSQTTLYASKSYEKATKNAHAYWQDKEDTKGQRKTKP